MLSQLGSWVLPLCWFGETRAQLDLMDSEGCTEPQAVNERQTEAAKPPSELKYLGDCSDIMLTKAEAGAMASVRDVIGASRCQTGEELAEAAAGAHNNSPIPRHEISSLIAKQSHG